MKMKWVKTGALLASTVSMAAMAAICAVHLKSRLDTARSREGQGGAPAHLPPELASAVADGIREHAPVFDGLYESLFQAARNRDIFSTDAYEEWCIRAEHLRDETFCAAFSALFSQSDIANEKFCREKFADLLSCIAQAGISRMQENGVTYTADQAMRQAYLSIDGGKLEIGKAYTVVKSAWCSDAGTVEYGMAQLQSGEEGAMQL